MVELRLSVGLVRSARNAQTTGTDSPNVYNSATTDVWNVAVAPSWRCETVKPRQSAHEALLAVALISVVFGEPFQHVFERLMAGVAIPQTACLHAQPFDAVGALASECFVVGA